MRKGRRFEDLERRSSAMVSDFSYLRDLYPPVITLDQLYRICHLSKRKAKWLLESRIIPCQDSGKKTRRFKIQLDDVIAYLEDTASGKRVVHFPVGLFSSHAVTQKTAKRRSAPCRSCPEFAAAAEKRRKNRCQNIYIPIGTCVKTYTTSD